MNVIGKNRIVQWVERFAGTEDDVRSGERLSRSEVEISPEGVAASSKFAGYVNILGIRGLPAAYGGFESCAAHLAPYLRDAGWKVTAYCQAEEGISRPIKRIDAWEGIRRIHIQTRTRGQLATVEFDLRCVLDVLGRPGIDLVFGYNTAIFNTLERLCGRRIVMNMDGIEWKRQKWGRFVKAWLWTNEWIGAHICHVPIADHPEITPHLASRGCHRTVLIPYASDEIHDAPVALLAPYGLVPKTYFISIARIEPENSIVEIIEAFKKAKTGLKLVVLGNLRPDQNSYHARVCAAADEQVVLPGGIYDTDVVQALRFHCLAYIHGHQVGGTNPSLVEALGAGSAIIANDNLFNRWTAGEGQLFFKGVEACAAHMALLATDNSGMRERLSDAARARHRVSFRFEQIHEAYREVIESQLVAADRG